MATPAKKPTEELPVVSIVGRVNVGKSTLFNKLTETSKALVSTIPGTTRTRNIGKVTWRGKKFTLIDTGGLIFSENVPLENEIVAQTEKAIEQSDLIIFLTDIKTGILPQEKNLAKLLMKKKNKVIFVANKADSQRLAVNAHEQEWLKLGFGAPYAVSATSGLNIGDLLDDIFKKLNKDSAKRPKTGKEQKPIKIALLGKPNVGKSSLFNALIGEEEVIVNDMPHTTREPFDTIVEVDDKIYQFIDTAGIRRKAKVAGELEQAGIGKSIEQARRSDIVLLLLDASEPLSSQDQQLAGLLAEHAKSTIIVVNKWDLTESNEDAFRNEVKQKIYAAVPHLDFAPIVFVSAKTKYRVHQIFDLIDRAWQGRQTVIPQEELDIFLKQATHEHRPSRGKGTRHPKIMGFEQINANPPIFEMFIKMKTSLHFSYVHFLENKLREKFGFFATPIIIRLTKLRRN